VQHLKRVRRNKAVESLWEIFSRIGRYMTGRWWDNTTGTSSMPAKFSFLGGHAEAKALECHVSANLDALQILQRPYQQALHRTPYLHY